MAGLPSAAEPPSATEADARAALDDALAAWVAGVAPSDRGPAGALAAALASSRTDAIRQLPSAAREAMAVCDDPRSGVGELARVCERDLAVAPALLRYANSAFFARPGQGPAASVREAVDRVGVGGVRSVLVDVTVSRLLCGPASRHAGLAAQLWTHAQRTAAVARAVAPAFGAAPERAYVAGLLHDVGKLVLLDRAAGAGATGVAWPALRAGLLALHEPLGALAVARWGLGDDVARAVGGHHRRAAPPDRDAVAEAVFLAERADHAVRTGDALDVAALWEAGALTGDRERATAALQAHLGPVLTLAEPAAA